MPGVGAGFRNLDEPETLDPFIPDNSVTASERAARRGHVISFIGGVMCGALCLLAFQWLTEVVF
jgi:hypothetical protein